MTSIDLVNQFYQDAVNKYKTLNELKALLNGPLPNGIAGNIAELERQRNVHQTVQTPTSANDLIDVNRKLQPWYGKKKITEEQILVAEKAYNDAQDLYVQKQNELLSEDQKKQLAEQQASINNAKDAQASAQKAIEDAKAFVQKNTKYLIYGAIALVLLGIGIFLYRKNFSA